MISCLDNLANLYDYDFGCAQEWLKINNKLMLLTSISAATSTPYLKIFYYAKHFFEQSVSHRSLNFGQ